MSEPKERGVFRRRELEIGSPGASFWRIAEAAVAAEDVSALRLEPLVKCAVVGTSKWTEFKLPDGGPKTCEYIRVQGFRKYTLSSDNEQARSKLPTDKMRREQLNAEHVIE